MIALDFKAAKGLFLDREAVARDLDRTTAKALAKAGAWIRTTARNSIRSVPASKRFTAPPSNPGEPPRSRVGHLKRFLFFVYEPSAKSVVVGPARIARATGPGTPPPTAVFTGSSVVVAWKSSVAAFHGTTGAKLWETELKEGGELASVSAIVAASTTPTP